MSGPWFLMFLGGVLLGWALLTPGLQLVASMVGGLIIGIGWATRKAL